MLRMSRSAWNNVLIFTMVLMILLFNTTNNILTGGSDSSDDLYLLPEASQLMTLQMPNVSIERIGQGWRATPPQAVQEAQIATVVQHWQSTAIQPVDEDIPSQMPTIVIAWLAGENSGRVFQFYQIDGQTLVLTQQQLFVLPDTSLDELLLGR